MTSLIPQLQIAGISTTTVPTQKHNVKAAAQNVDVRQICELTNLPTSNMLAQFIKTASEVAAIREAQNAEPFVWKNDLKQLIQDNKAVIWAMIPRTFNAQDIDGDGLVEEGEVKGTFLNAIGRLDSLKEMGVNTLHVLPIHEPGKIHAKGISGSVYAPKDMLSIDPELRDPNDPRDVKEQMKAFVDACHKKGIRVMLDLPSCASCDLFDSNPELMAIERNGNAKTPQGWEDIRMFDPWHDESQKTLNPYLLDLHKKYVDMCIELGIDGIRADVARAKPTQFWDIIIPYSHSKDPNFAWLAETYTYEDASPQLNMMYDRPKDMLKAGFDTYYGQYHIFHEWLKADELTKYVRENIEMSNESDDYAKKSVIGSFATHDDVSPMLHGGVKYCNLTTGLQATLPMMNPYFVDGFHSGDEYIYPYENNVFGSKKDVATTANNKKKVLEVHTWKLDIFNHSRRPGGKYPEIGNFVASAMKMRKQYEDVITKGSYIPLPQYGNDEDQIIAYARHKDGKTLIVIANRNVNKREKGLVAVPGLKQGAQLKNLVDAYGEQSGFQVKEDGVIAVNLGAARFHVFEVDTPNIEEVEGLEILKQNI